MKTLVLFSGGLDSAVLLCIYAPRALAVSFDYGQSHSIEIEHAARFCKAREIEHLIAPITVAGGSLLDPAQSSPIAPARNLIMLATAASIAKQKGCDQLAIGVTAEDQDLFHDCRPAFLANLNAILQAQSLPTALAPLAGLNKRQITQLARRLGVDPKETWSCYHPTNDRPCGECLACDVRKKGQTP